MSVPRPYLLSVSALAKLADVAQSTVSNWISDGMPTGAPTRKGRRARIDAWVALPWIIAHRREPPGSERERLARAQADRQELLNQQARASLVYADDVRNELSAWTELLRTQVAALVNRVPSHLCEAMRRECNAMIADVERRRFRI